MIRAAFRLAGIMVVGAGMLSGAAATEVGVTEGVAPLSPQSGFAAKALVKRVLASSSPYQAAPVPDQDASAPVEAQKAEASVGPKFISPRSLFQGDGYASGSSAEGSLDSRRTAAAGLGLSLPLDDDK